MNTTSRILVSILALLIVCLGVTTVASIKRAQDINAQLQQAQSDLAKRKGSRDSGGQTSEERLRELLNQQEAANAQLREELARLREVNSAAQPAKDNRVDAGATATQRPGRGGGGAWMERLRQEDPARYKQIVEQREQRRKATDKWFQDQISALDQTAQTAASQDEAEIASQIADTLAKINDLRSQWAALRDMPEDQRTEAAQQLQEDTRNTYSTLNDLRTNYQDLQFGKVLSDAGLDPKSVQATVPQLNKVLTDSRNLLPPRGGGGWGDGPGGQNSANSGTSATGGQTQNTPPPPR